MVEHLISIHEALILGFTPALQCVCDTEHRKTNFPRYHPNSKPQNNLSPVKTMKCKETPKDIACLPKPGQQGPWGPGHWSPGTNRKHSHRCCNFRELLLPCCRTHSFLSLASLFLKASICSGPPLSLSIRTAGCGNVPWEGDGKIRSSRASSTM